LAVETLALTRVGASYGQVQVLRDITLSLPPGKTLAVLGANGSGKTTLLRAITGIMVRREGEAKLGAIELHKLEAHEIVHAGISHVPEGKHLFKPLTVAENLDIGAISLNRSGRSAEADEARALVYELFPVLKAREKQVSGTLSGGEQQMLAIGRALMARPRVLLLDEPSVGLAPRVNEQLFAALGKLKLLGMSIVVAEQLIKLACDLADEAIVMHLGRIAMQASAAQVRDDPELKRLYLGG